MLGSSNIVQAALVVAVLSLTLGNFKMKKNIIIISSFLTIALLVLALTYKRAYRVYIETGNLSYFHIGQSKLELSEYFKQFDKNHSVSYIYGLDKYNDSLVYVHNFDVFLMQVDDSQDSIQSPYKLWVIGVHAPLFSDYYSFTLTNDTVSKIGKESRFFFEPVKYLR